MLEKLAHDTGKWLRLEERDGKFCFSVSFRPLHFFPLFGFLKSKFDFLSVTVISFQTITKMFGIFSRVLPSRKVSLRSSRPFSYSSGYRTMNTYTDLRDQSFERCQTLPSKLRKVVAKQKTEMKIGAQNIPVMYSIGNSDEKIIFIRLARKGILICDDESYHIMPTRRNSSLKRSTQTYRAYEQPSIISQNEAVRRLRRNQRALSRLSSDRSIRTPKKILYWDKVSSIVCRDLELRITINSSSPEEQICVFKFFVITDLKSFVSAGISRNYFHFIKSELIQNKSRTLSERFLSLFSLKRSSA